MTPKDSLFESIKQENQSIIIIKHDKDIGDLFNHNSEDLPGK